MRLYKTSLINHTWH